MSTVEKCGSPDKKAEKVVKKKKKKPIPGVVYLSTIPPFMNVTKIRDFFSTYGEIDKLFLQPEKKGFSKKPSKIFTEGWVEFKNKKIAKRVAIYLNNKQVGGKKRSKNYDCLWNIKYLHRFRWEHLNERLAYEKAVHDQRVRTEISQAKRETNFYIKSVDTGKKLANLEKRVKKEGKQWVDKSVDLKQTLTEDEFRSEGNKKKDKKHRKQELENSNSNTAMPFDKSVLFSIFGNNTHL